MPQGNWPALFAEFLRSCDRSNTTVRYYLADLRRFASWFERHTGEAFSPQAVTEYDLREWRDFLAKERKPATVNRALASLRVFFRWALESGWAGKDPTRHISGLSQTTTAPKALNSQDLKRILRRVHQGESCATSLSWNSWPRPGCASPKSPPFG